MRKHATGSPCALIQLLLAASLLGCTPPAPPAPSTLSTFTADTVPGVFSHDVVLTNHNNKLLRQVDLTVTVYFETKVETLTLHWGYWNHEERQTVNVPASGRIQRIAFVGTALAGAEQQPVQLSANWIIKYEQAK